MILSRSPRKLLVVFCIVLTIVALATAAGANVVTISPSNPGDWSWMTNATSAKGYFTQGGPAPAEGNPFPTGNGAFYAQLSWSGSTSGQTDNAWLGLDRHNNQSLAGIPLKNIKKLEYVVYNAGMYTAKIGTTNPRRHAKQPFMVTLSAVSPTSGERRHFLYRPWGFLGWPHWNNRREWLTLDAINMTSTPDFAIGGQTPPLWYEFTTNTMFYSWQELIDTFSVEEGFYGDWVLASTSTYYDPTHIDPVGWKSPGWDSTTTPPGEPRTTGTGKPLSLWVGARKATETVFGGAWVQESMGFKGYVDSLTLGIDYGTEEAPNVVETTYDFASDDPAPRIAAVCNIGKSRWGSNPPYDYPYATYNPTLGNQDKFLYKFFGQVIDATVDKYGPALDTDTHEFYFTIWDGSKADVSSGLFWKPLYTYGAVSVRMPWHQSSSDPIEWPVEVGDWVSVVGYLYDGYYFQIKPPTEITTNAANLHKYYPESQ